MTEPITKFDDEVEIYCESGSARLRFKAGVVPLDLIHNEKANQVKQIYSRQFG